MKMTSSVSPLFRSFAFRSLIFRSLILPTLLAAFVNSPSAQAQVAAPDAGFESAIGSTQPKMVKLMGSGGFRGLEPYQSAFLISSDGYILTVWSYVLDSDNVIATLDNGQRFEAKLVGYDPRIEIALLKIEATDLLFFNLEAAVELGAGSKVLAFSNLYGVASGDEPSSVLHGIVSVKTKLAARKGAQSSTYQDDVYVLDAMTNNPGAPGGAVTDIRGNLAGLIGKELRDKQSNSWINFAIPVDKMLQSVNDIRSGKMIIQTDFSQRMPTEPMSTQLLGFELVTDVVTKTPPYVDRVQRNSLAAEQGIQPDDLIIEVNGRMTPTCRDVHQLLGTIDRDSLVELTIQRGKKFQSLNLRLVR